MRRLLVGLALVATSSAALALTPTASAAPFCDRSALCPEPLDPLYSDAGRPVGHDEPSVLFYDKRPGSGYDQTYRIQIPTEPPTLPSQPPPGQQVGGGTWNFQLHPAFWFGQALCEPESFPINAKPCVPRSDSNIYEDLSPTSSRFIGKHPGVGFTEVQFYPPGWAPWPAGLSCHARKWCVAFASFQLSLNAHNNVANNESCLDTVGIEPVNFAFLTKNGMPHADPSPLGATNATFTPDQATDIFLNPGDWVVLEIKDTVNGLFIGVHDETTGQSGSITANAANGFAHVLYEPNAKQCHQERFTWHSAYATSSPKTRVPWAAHSYNVAYSDEIGHFEFCSSPKRDFTCGDAGSAGDEPPCFPAGFTTLVDVTGCIGSDYDFDGTSYRRAWPGTGTNAEDAALHSTPVTFTSPTFDGGKNYRRVAFEVDLPRIEAIDSGGPCHRNTGEGCVNPPPGADFYPSFTTAMAGDTCVWREGGLSMPGTLQTFGPPPTQYGPLLNSPYLDEDAVNFRYNNFRRILSHNPCPA